MWTGAGGSPLTHHRARAFCARLLQFTGNILGHASDIADGSLRGFEFRSLSNIVGDYYVPPKFLEKVVVHIAKNYLIAQGAFDAQVRARAHAPPELLLVFRAPVKSASAQRRSLCR